MEGKELKFTFDDEIEGRYEIEFIKNSKGIVVKCKIANESSAFVSEGVKI